MTENPTNPKFDVFELVKGSIQRVGLDDDTKTVWRGASDIEESFEFSEPKAILNRVLVSNFQNYGDYVNQRRSEYSAYILEQSDPAKVQAFDAAVFEMNSLKASVPADLSKMSEAGVREILESMSAVARSALDLFK